MRRSLALSVIAFTAICAVAASPKDKHVGRFGGIVVTVTAIQILPGSIQTIQGATQKHFVAVFATFKNASKNAACFTVVPRLKATFGLDYLQSLERIQANFPNPPMVKEMLPGEESHGAYVFLVRDGAEPLELELKREDKTIRCNAPPEGTWGDSIVPDEIRLDVHDLPAPAGR